MLENVISTQALCQRSVASVSGLATRTNHFVDLSNYELPGALLLECFSSTERRHRSRVYDTARKIKFGGGFQEHVHHTTARDPTVDVVTILRVRHGVPQQVVALVS